MLVPRTAPNKSLQRSGTHKVLSRGRPNAHFNQLPRARVLTSQLAAAELSRWATLQRREMIEAN